MNWQALSAIGQWLSAIATFMAVIVALKPYLRKTSLSWFPKIIIENNQSTDGIKVVIRNVGE